MLNSKRTLFSMFFLSISFFALSVFKVNAAPPPPPPRPTKTQLDEIARKKASKDSLTKTESGKTGQTSSKPFLIVPTDVVLKKTDSKVKIKEDENKKEMAPWMRELKQKSSQAKIKVGKEIGTQKETPKMTTKESETKKNNQIAALMQLETLTTLRTDFEQKEVKSKAKSTAAIDTTQSEKGKSLHKAKELLQEIEKGRQLRKVTGSQKNKYESPRSKFLKDIEKGITLKHVDIQKKKPTANLSGVRGILSGSSEVLERAKKAQEESEKLKAYRRAQGFHDDNDDDESDWSEDED